MGKTRTPMRPLTAAEGEKVVGNRGLVLLVARRLFSRPDVARLGDFDDVFQIGYLGLMRAVQKFDPSRGFKFSTFAVWCIKNEICRAVQRRRHPIGRLVSDPLDYRAGLDAIDNAELIAAIRAAVAKLPPRERSLIEAKYFAGRSLVPDRKRLGVSRQQIYQLKARALKMLREELNGKSSATGDANAVETNPASTGDIQMSLVDLSTDRKKLQIHRGGDIEVHPGGRITPACGVHPPAIPAAASAAGEAPTAAEFNAVVAKLNAALAALRGVGIISP